ncbi:flagellar associated protein [Nannochloropsis oceanica]
MKAFALSRSLAIFVVGGSPSFVTSSAFVGSGALISSLKKARPSPLCRRFSMAAESVYNLTVDDFCLRQFSPEYGGSKITMPPAEFEARVNAYYHANPHLADGYAPFCKHIFMPNFAGLTAGTAPITPENEHLLRSVYEARTEQELPVMVRFFPKDLVPPRRATHLDIILYSREQIRKENADMGNPDKAASHETAPWGIISVKAQDADHELPMQPITMLRNALGREYGGSGVELVREKYLESVDFWSQNAIIR